MSCICRTCLSKITGQHYIDINQFQFAKKQLTLCIPEIDFDLVLDQVICMNCAKALYAAYIFKSCCLHTEQRIHTYVQKLAFEQENLQSEAITSNEDITNTCNSSTPNLEEANKDHLLTGDNCNEMTSDSADKKHDNAVGNYNSIIKENFEIQEIKLNTLIKSEVFNSCSKQQWPQFEDGSNKIQDVSEDQLEGTTPNHQLILAKLVNRCKNISNSNKLMLNRDNCEVRNSIDITNCGPDCVNLSTNMKDIDMCADIEMDYEMHLKGNDAAGASLDDGLLQESGNGFNFEKHSANLVMNNVKSIGLLEQCSKSDYVNYITNNENCNLSAIRAEASAKQNNCGAKSPEVDVGLEPKNSFPSVSLMQRCQVNARRTSDTSNYNSLKMMPEQMSSKEPECYRLSQNETNIEEQIGETLGLRMDLLKDCKKILTHEILDIDKYEVMNGIKTENNESDYQTCDASDLDMESNIIATKAEVELNTEIDQSQLHLNHEDTSDLLNSSTSNDVSSHLVNYEGVSIHGKNQELSSCSQFEDTIGQKLHKYKSCDFESLQKNNLNRPVKIHCEKQLLQCNLCDYVATKKSRLMRHMKVHTGEKPHNCNFCDYASSEKSTLKKHIMSLHTKEKPYKCYSCAYATSRRDSLMVHVANHAGTKGYLNKELNKHTTEKTYKCNYCDYANSRKDGLVLHIANHTGEKPHKCNLCDYSTAKKHNFKAHVKGHSGDKPYKCNSCDHAAAQKSSLKKHVLAHHTGERSHKCHLCDFASCRKGNLKRHIMMRHT